jgi:hypothetical protein
MLWRTARLSNFWSISQNVCYTLLQLLREVASVAFGSLSMADEKIAVHRHRITDLESYDVTADELDRLQYEDPQRGHELSFALAALSIVLSLVIPLVVGRPPEISSQRLAVFVGLIAAAFICFLFFGFRWLNNRKQRDALFDRIRARQIGPVGEKGSEISTDALAGLPSVDATRYGTLTADAALKGPDRETKE